MKRIALAACRGCGIAILFLVGLFFIPGACVTPFVGVWAVERAGGDDQWKMLVFGGSILISVSLLMLGELLNGSNNS